MASVGIDERTGAILIGWPRTYQSIQIIVRTEIGERVQRRDIGSRVPLMIDRPQNEQWMLNTFMAIYEALEPRLGIGNRWLGEPCFSLRLVSADVTVPGKPRFLLSGYEVPNGHLGDFTTGLKRRDSVVVTL